MRRGGAVDDVLEGQRGNEKQDSLAGPFEATTLEAIGYRLCKVTIQWNEASTQTGGMKERGDGRVEWWRNGCQTRAGMRRTRKMQCAGRGRADVNWGGQLICPSSFRGRSCLHR